MSDKFTAGVSNVVSRRTLLKFGLGACTAGAMIAPGSTVPGSIMPGSIMPGSIMPGSIMPGSIMPGSAQARLVRNSVVPYYKAVFDERFGDPCVFAAGAAERGIPTVAIRGDITKLFLDDLDLRWKWGPVLLAGYTTPASLFCLDLLARDRGMRVRHCVTGPSVEAALGVLDGTLPRQCATHMPSRDASVPVFWIIAPR